MPIPIDGLPPRTLTWTFLGLAAVFAVVTVIKTAMHGPLPAIAVPACLALALGGAAWLTSLGKSPKASSSESHKLAGRGR